MKIVVFILFSLILCHPSSAQFRFSSQPGVQESSLGGAGLILSKGWQSWYNPALFGKSIDNSTAVTASSRIAYIGTGIRNHSIAITRKWNYQGIGGGLIWEKLPGIRRINIHLSYGRKLGPRLSTGLRFDRENYSIPTENISNGITRFALFSNYQWSEELLLSLQTAFTHSSDLFQESTEGLFFAWGLGWFINEKNILQIEFGNPGSMGSRWSVGLQRSINSKTGLFLGISGMPMKVGWGIDWNQKNFRIVIGGFWSPGLPAGSGIEWSYAN